MREVPLYSLDGVEVEKMKLPAEVFSLEPNQGALYAYLKAYSFNQGQGTSATKGRSQLKGGGAKPWRQKGTGRARAGSSNSPLWVGGGRAFGPSPHPRHRDIPKKMKRLALKSALSSLAQKEAVLGLEEIKIESPKTRVFASLLGKLGLKRKRCLLLVASNDPNLLRATSNLPNLKLRRATDTNAYEVLSSDCLILTQGAVRALQGALS